MSFSKKNSTKGKVQNLLPGFVLGILEPFEEEIVADYLTKHPELKPEVKHLEEVITYWAYSAPAVTPPLAIKEKILVSVQSSLAN